MEKHLIIQMYQHNHFLFSTNDSNKISFLRCNKELVLSRDLHILQKIHFLYDSYLLANIKNKSN